MLRDKSFAHSLASEVNSDCDNTSQEEQRGRSVGAATTKSSSKSLALKNSICSEVGSDVTHLPAPSLTTATAP